MSHEENGAIDKEIYQAVVRSNVESLLAFVQSDDPKTEDAIMMAASEVSMVEKFVADVKARMEHCRNTQRANAPK
jgi:hypothetical protein